MKKYIIILLTTVCFYSYGAIKEDRKYSSTAPKDPFTIGKEQFELDTANYLGSINQLKLCESNYQTENDKWLYKQAALTYNTFVENNKEYNNLLTQLYTSEKDINTLYTDKEALEYLKSEIANQQVVMINEQHWQSKHRFLGNTLLSYFYSQGFRYLAVEAIDNDGEEEVTLNERKYPLQSSGFYIKDPQFGNLIRNALKLGFQVVAYDVFSKDRELIEAQNIYNKTIAKNKNAKVLVWAGVGHIIEQKSDKPKMAYHFKEISGINPLTIEQTQGDHNSILLKNSYLAIDADTTKKSKCDIFLINNISETDYKVDPQAEDKSYTVKLSSVIKNKLKRHKNLILSVYYEDEFEAHRLNSVPVKNLLIETNDNISISLPRDDRFIGIIRSPLGTILETYHFPRR